MFRMRYGWSFSFNELLVCVSSPVVQFFGLDVTGRSSFLIDFHLLQQLYRFTEPFDIDLFDFIIIFSVSCMVTVTHISFRISIYTLICLFMLFHIIHYCGFLFYFLALFNLFQLKLLM